MYHFGETSLSRLKTTHPELQAVLEKAIELSAIDFGIAEGFRQIGKQKELFDAGKSTKDGVNKLSKHNYQPSLAVDIFGWVNSKTNYDLAVLCYLAGVIMTTAAAMNVRLRWGGNWDMDGEIMTDQKFQDLVHFELI